MQHFYLIAIGSNRPHHRHGHPAAVLKAAIKALSKAGTVQDIAPSMPSAPIGPSRRRYANGAVLLESTCAPPDLLAQLKTIERAFGARRGQRWSTRTLDLDIILWSGGIYADDRLLIPHPHFRDRDFVLRPMVAIAPDWIDPISGLTPRQLLARLSKPKAASVTG